jgi:small subunit ribosomal protein S20
VLNAAGAGNVEEAEANFKVAAKRLDQAASKNVIHKNAASRKKSRLAHAIVKAKKSAS